MTRSGVQSTHFVPLGAVGRVTRDERSVLIALGDVFLRVDVIRSDILRLKISQAGRFDEAPTFAAAFAMPPPVRFELRESPERVEVATERLTLIVRCSDAALDVYRHDGTPVLESERDEAGRSIGYLSLNDSFVVSRRARKSDAVFGLGQKTGAFDRRGRSFVLWNLDVLAPNALRQNRLFERDLNASGKSPDFDPYYTTIPFFQHAREAGDGLAVAGFFVDNAYKANFDLTQPELIRFQFWGGQYTEYVFAGPDLPSILEAYTFITGRMRLPPVYALGHHQCRWHDYTQDDVVALGRRYRKSELPCDVLWLDIGHMDGYRVFSWHPQRFPDVPRLLTELERERFRCITIVDPGVKYEAGYALFEEGRSRDLFCKTESGQVYSGEVWPGRTAFPDFSKAETRGWWAELNAAHVGLGLAGVWNDMNEPATGDVDPFAMRFDRDGANHPHERYHNQYGLLMALATEQGLLSGRPEQRPFILSRAGFAGIQRVAAQWLGDNCSSWEHLVLGLPMAFGMGVSGQAFIGADIPGFSSNATPELAARWFEYGALTPFCRCHNERGNQDHYPWSFGQDVERVARAALRLRYQLLPYLYACFLRTAASGEPVQRPMVWDFPNDGDARTRDDQYLLGPALLVAPVLTQGARERWLHLPAGTWYDWHSGDKHVGPSRLHVAAPLGRTPLFARGGFVVPLWNPAPASTFGFFPDSIELHVFVPDTDGTQLSVLYEDDGVTLSHLTGRYLRTDIELTRRARQLLLRATVAGGGYPEHRRAELRLVFHGLTSAQVRLRGAWHPLVNGTLTLANSGQDFELSVEL